MCVIFISSIDEEILDHFSACVGDLRVCAAIATQKVESRSNKKAPQNANTSQRHKRRRAGDIISVETFNVLFAD